jgi:hypothetical protein
VLAESRNRSTAQEHAERSRALNALRARVAVLRSQYPPKPKSKSAYEQTVGNGKPVAPAVPTWRTPSTLQFGGWTFHESA